MAEHDYNLANATGAAFRTDLNNALAAIVSWNSKAGDPTTTFAYMRAVNTTTGVVKRRNAANSAWIIESTVDETRVLTRASNTILDVSDIGKAIRATATFTQTFDAAATLGDGWEIDYRIESGSTITFDPNAAELIDGATTLAVVGPASLRIVCNGTEFRTVSIEQPASDTVAGKIEIATQAEQETGTDTVRAVTPGRQKFNPGHPKAWLKCDAAGNINASYNITSVTDTGTGDVGVTINTNFSSTHYAVISGVEGSALHISLTGSSQAAGTFSMNCRDTVGTLVDPSSYFFIACGDQV